ncbi:MAG: hypothetical protein QXF41_01625 [Candidatus Micrarchaeaceae archaeon]
MKNKKEKSGKVRGMMAQGSLEYIMMLAAASIVIVIALAMVVGLKGAVVTHMDINNTNMSIVQAIAHELSSLSSNSV